MLIVADGAPGLIKAIEQCWPASDRQRCCVHCARNLYAKLPDRERERVKRAYWQALDDSINERDAKQRLHAPADKVDTGGFTAAARCRTPAAGGRTAPSRRADSCGDVPIHSVRLLGLVTTSPASVGAAVEMGDLRELDRRSGPARRAPALPDPAPPAWRSTNLLERSLGEVKRRTKVTGRFPGEDSCLTWSGPSWISSSPTRPTASRSPNWTANDPTASNIANPTTSAPRR